MIALAVSVLILLAEQSKAQNSADPAVVKFLAELRETRAPFDRYKVNCTIKSSDFSEYPRGLKISYHVSKPDEHSIIVYDYSGCEASAKLPTKWIGKSGQYFVSGEVGTVSRLRDWPQNFDPMKTVPHFDVMGLGFGFFGELKFGTQLDRIIENYTKYRSVHVTDKEDIALLYSSNGRPRIVVDKKRGTWPIKSELDHALWAIQLQDFEDVHVPIQFEFTSLDNRNQSAGNLVVDLNWELVGQPFTVGPDAAAALANQYGCEFVQNPEGR